MVLKRGALSIRTLAARILITYCHNSRTANHNSQTDTSLQLQTPTKSKISNQSDSAQLDCTFVPRDAVLLLCSWVCEQCTVCNVVCVQCAMCTVVYSNEHYPTIPLSFPLFKCFKTVLELQFCVCKCCITSQAVNNILLYNVF